MQSQILDVKPCNPDVHRFIGKVIGKAFYQSVCQTELTALLIFLNFLQQSINKANLIMQNH